MDIRRFENSDIEFAIRQTAREGWDTTPELLSVTLDHDPEGCFVGEVDGEPVGMITSTRYARSAWVGNLIITPEARRRGHGETLMRHAKSRLEGLGVETFRLEADPMGVGLYLRMGFRDQFRSLRLRKDPPHGGQGGGPDKNTEAVNVAHVHVADIIDYDRARFGDDRARWLGRLLELAPWSMCSRGENGGVNGYAAALPSTEGVRFGPCVAEDAETAAVLLESMMRVFDNVPIVAAVPEVNVAAVTTMKTMGFEVVDFCRRMILGEPAGESDPGKLVALAYGAVG